MITLTDVAKGDSPTSGLTKAEQAAREKELADARSRLVRRVLITLGVVAIPLYIWAATVISAHNK